MGTLHPVGLSHRREVLTTECKLPYPATCKEFIGITSESYTYTLLHSSSCLNIHPVIRCITKHTYIQDSGKMCLLTYIIYVFNLHIYIGLILGHHHSGARTIKRKPTSALLLLLTCNKHTVIGGVSIKNTQ